MTDKDRTVYFERLVKLRDIRAEIALRCQVVQALNDVQETPIDPDLAAMAKEALGHQLRCFLEELAEERHLELEDAKRGAREAEEEKP